MKDTGFMPEPVGRYQISTASNYFLYDGNIKINRIYETTLDTRTGEIIKREQYATNTEKDFINYIDK